MQRTLPSCFLPLLLATPAAAQIPEGWVVTSQTSDLVGISVCAPRTSAQVLPVGNVPAELKLTLNVSRGASCVLIHPSGDLVGGNLVTRTDDALVIHVMQLSGLGVTQSQRYQVGTAANSNGSVTHMQNLPDGRIVFTTANKRSSGALGVQNVGVLDPATGTIAAVPVGGGASSLLGYNAIAVSADGSELYLGVWLSSTSGQVLRVPVGGGTATLVSATPFGVTGLDVDMSGQLVVAMNNASAGMGRIDLSTSIYTPIAGTPRDVGAVAVERATGNYMYLWTTNPGSIRTVQLFENGVSAVIATLPAGTTTGIDVQDSPRAFGEASPGANSYAWRTSPNPGGIPLLGNLGFGLTLDSSPEIASASAIALSAARASIAVAGIELLLDPATLFTVPIASAMSVTVPIGIVNQPAMVGLVLHAQSLHIDALGLAASGGLTFGPIAP